MPKKEVLEQSQNNTDHGHHHSHDHGHSHAHHHSGDNIGLAFFLNFAFTIVEFIGGFLTNSIAIQSDALHDLGDTLSLGLAWYFQKLSKKKRDLRFTYGYRRFNTLGAMLTGLILVAGSVFILMRAIPRLMHPEETQVNGMIWLAILGVVVNGIAALKVNQGGGSLNEKMISWHLIEDVLGWVVVLIGSILMYFFDLPWIDPALSILITFYIFYNVVKNLWHTSKVILQASPDHIDIGLMEENMKLISGVTGVHHIHLWTMDGEINLLSATIETDGDRKLSEVKGIKEQLNKLLKADFMIAHTTLEFVNEDFEEEPCI